jgi:hypothetical protein
MPYRGQRRQYNPYGGSGGRLSDLMLAQGEQQANLAREQGDIWGQFLQNVGQTAGDTLQAYQKDERERPAREQAQRTADMQEDELTRSLAEREKEDEWGRLSDSYKAEWEYDKVGRFFIPTNIHEKIREMPPEHQAQFIEENQAMLTAFGNAMKARDTALGTWAQSVDAEMDEMEANPALFGVALSPLVINNLLDENTANSMAREAIENPASIRVRMRGLMLSGGVEPKEPTPPEVITTAPGETVFTLDPSTREKVMIHEPTLPDVAEIPYHFVKQDDGSVVAINKNDPSQHIVAIEASGQPPAKEQPSFKNRQEIRDAFIKEVEALNEIDDAVSVMDTALNMLNPEWQGAVTDAEGNVITRGGDHNMPAASQMILVKFQKVLDPGSVVRESEYARSASGQSVWNRIAAFFSGAQIGGELTKAQLESFANMAKEYAAKRQEGITGTIQFYADAARRDLDLEVADVLSGVSLFDNWSRNRGEGTTGSGLTQGADGVYRLTQPTGGQ